MTVADFPRGGPSWGWTSIGVVFHRGGLSSWWTFIVVDFHRGGLSSEAPCAAKLAERLLISGRKLKPTNHKNNLVHCS